MESIFTKSKLRKAGEVLKDERASMAEYYEACDIVNRYRSLFNVPLNAFQMTLRNRLKSLKLRGSLAAQRLKRFSTILFKLQRFSNMQLDRMHDIGGVRAIVANMDDLRKLYDVYRNPSKKFTHKLKRVYDYINNPKSSGYRGYHLVFEYNSPTAARKQYNGLCIELQMRTQLQHAWATAVETFETFMGERFKSSIGNSDWLNFFALMSSLFAMEEGEKVLKEHEHLSKEELESFAREKIKELDVIHKISTFSRFTYDSKRFEKEGAAHCLLILNKAEHFTHVLLYDKYRRAYAAYKRKEEEAKINENLQVLLLRMDSLKKLVKAYPNFFVNLHEFEKRVRAVVAKS